MTYVLSITDPGVVITATLKDPHGTVLPKAAGTWTESSEGSMLALLGSDDTSVTFKGVAAGTATVTYTDGKVTGTFEVVVAEEASEVELTAVAYVPAEVAAEPVDALSPADVPLV